MKPKVIAIDGYSSTGKSSLAKKIATALGFIHVDTGAMYRAIAWYAMQNGLIAEDGDISEQDLISQLPLIETKFAINPESGKNEIYLNGENVESKIRGMEVSNKVSQIAKVPQIRKHLVKLQRAMANDVGIVMDGRDIGSVVFPDAPVKIFLTASPKARAKRRFDELKSNGIEISMEEVERNINKRDLLDTQRATSPLVKADDAIEVNNDNLNQYETFERVMEIIKEKGL